MIDEYKALCISKNKPKSKKDLFNLDVIFKTLKKKLIFGGNMKIKDLPNLSIYHNILSLFNKIKSIDKWVHLDNKAQISFVNNVLTEIDEVSSWVKHHNNKDIYELKFIKPKSQFFIDISKEYNEMERDFEINGNLAFDYFSDNTIVYNAIDMRNTQKQYRVIEYNDNKYLYEFSIEFLFMDLEEKAKLFNHLSLPFMNGVNWLDDSNYFTNFNSILGLVVYKIPNYIKLSKIEDTLYSIEDGVKKKHNEYKITSKFVKEIKSVYNNIYNPIDDNELFKLFESGGEYKNKRKKKKKLKVGNNKLLDKCEEVNEDIIEEKIEDNEEVREINEEIKTIPFKISYKYQSIEKDKLSYERLFTDLFYSNPRFNQMIKLDNIKNIYIYKPYQKSYSNLTYFNASMNGINHHFYIHNKKITSITKIINLI